METTFEKLNLFFERIKTIGFWQRIFGWRELRTLSYEAYQDFKTLCNSLNTTLREFEQSKNSIAVMTNDSEHLKMENSRLENSFTIVEEKLNAAQNELSQLTKENAGYKQTEADRAAKYENNVAALNAIQQRIQNERQEETEERQRNEIERLRSMKETWSKHQDNVKNAIKRICQKHTIEYIDQVPFRGSPDNTAKICDEFVIFDAKSPSSDDLQNFPNYIKSQTESVKKYVKEENVRKDIFLVIPSNTVDVIHQFSYNMGEYYVYVVTLDVLEPLMLSLKKIEDYKFIEELSPEERENICRVIGRFAHMTKRRIQIDHFFAWEFLDILTKCKADLPREILEKVIEFEMSEKLNPPQERRAKQILTKELALDTEKIQKEAEAKAIIFPPSLQKSLNDLPLYEGEELSETS